MFLPINNAYALTDCPSDQSLRFHNCFGAYTFTDGEKYVGEWQDDKRHGQGTYTFANGDKYVGEHLDGLQDGQGTYTFADGTQYVGEWQDNKRHGQGTYTFANGTIERGYYMNNEYVPDICEGMGITKGTEAFGNCVVELIKKL
tara:strand:- start:113 stop:544 length:432 start_codon:yes stop_codon:yes gene_type:complete